MPKDGDMQLLNLEDSVKTSSRSLIPQPLISQILFLCLLPSRILALQLLLT